MVESSGCIVVKVFNGEPHILMVHAAGNWRNKRFGFPKGHVDAGEDLEAAARRETKEETGIEVEVIDYLGQVKRKQKVVHAYIAYYKSGSLNGKDAIDYQREEVDAAKFVPVSKAIELAYDYQKPIFEKAKEYINQYLR